MKTPVYLRVSRKGQVEEMVQSSIEGNPNTPAHYIKIVVQVCPDEGVSGKKVEIRNIVLQFC